MRHEKPLLRICMLTSNRRKYPVDNKGSHFGMEFGMAERENTINRNNKNLLYFNR